MSARDPAQARFAVISLVRLLGVAGVIVGILVVRGIVGWPVPAGYTLLVLGLAGFFVLPLVLARRWRTPTE